jgi:hypothetical protein
MYQVSSFNFFLIVHRRGGSNIKSIASETSSKIQMTQKEDMASVATSERVVTVTGTLQACTSCICKVLDAMAVQQEVSQYSNMTTSYRKSTAGSQGGQASTVPSPVISPRFRAHTTEPLIGPPAYSLEGFADLNISPAMSTRMGSLGQQHTIHQLSAGYGQHVQPGQYTPVPSQAAYARGGSVMGDRNFPGGERSRLGRADNMYMPTGPSTSLMVSTFGVNQAQMHSSLAMANATMSMQVRSSPDIALIPRVRLMSRLTLMLPFDFAQVGVPETMIGAILGRGGSGINDLQINSGARIEVSQRGTFQPGTNNRIITMTGTEQTCATASFLINQRLSRPGVGTPHR